MQPYTSSRMNKQLTTYNLDEFYKQNVEKRRHTQKNMWCMIYLYKVKKKRSNECEVSEVRLV